MESNRDFGKLETYDYRKRIQSAICNETCQLLVLEKNIYNELLRSYHKDQLDKLIDLLRSFYCFQKYTKTQILPLLPFFIYRLYENGAQVFTENEKAEEMYFVIEGSFKLIKQINDSNQIEVNED